MTGTLGTHTKASRGNHMKKHAGLIALVAALVGVVGVYAGAHAFAPAPKPANVQFVQQPVAPVTPSSTTTTTATVAPKPVAPKPVQSVKAKAPAQAPVQRQAVMSTTPADPAPTTDPAPMAPDDPRRNTPPPPLPAHPIPVPDPSPSS